MMLRLSMIAALTLTAQAGFAQQADLPWVFVLTGQAGAGTASPPAGIVRPGDLIAAEAVQGQVLQIYRGPPPGLEPIWTDGRLNPDRGLPERQARVPVTRRPGPGEGMLPAPLR